MPTWLENVFPHRPLFRGDPRLLHLFIGRVLSSTGFSITIPFLALYLHGTRGTPMSAVGGMFFAAALAGAVAQILGGEWCDRYGRKPILVAAQAGRGLTFVAMGAAALTGGGFLVFVALTCASSFFGRLYEPPSGAMIADITAGERRLEAFGILRIGGNLGFAVGPVIGGFLAALSYAALFFASAAIMVISSILLVTNIAESLPGDRRRGAEAGIGDDLPAGMAAAPRRPRAPGSVDFASFAATLRDASFARHMIACLVFFTVMGQLMATFSVYVVEWAGLSKVQLGWIYSLNGALSLCSSFRSCDSFRPTG